MQTFEQWHKSQYSYINEEPFGECGQRRFAWTACDQQWREELAKDRGVMSYADWLASRDFELPDTCEDTAKQTWFECSALWRHKCLNIEQASSMKIAILERQLEEMRKDLDWATRTLANEEGILSFSDTSEAEEIRQRHKLDEVKA